jgi:hypothetical protein
VESVVAALEELRAFADSGDARSDTLELKEEWVAVQVENLVKSAEALQSGGARLAGALRLYLIVADPVFSRGYHRLHVAYERLSELQG